MDLTECRAEIDVLDAQIIELFQKRMEVCAEVAAYKKAHGLPVLNAGREDAKLADVAARTKPELRPSLDDLYRQIFRISREYQTKLLGQA